MKHVPDQNAPKLMTSGQVRLENQRGSSRLVSRGVPVIASEGIEVGKVAAVVLDGSGRKVTHLLMFRLPEMHGYWLIALDQIERVEEAAVRLSITAGAAAALPAWTTSSP